VADAIPTVPTAAGNRPLQPVVIQGIDVIKGSFGRTYRGRSLDVTVLAMDRMPQLRYTNFYTDGAKDHHRLLPSEEGKELVLVRISVANHTATSHIVDVNAQAAELNDYYQGRYSPVDVNAQGQSWAKSDLTRSYREWSCENGSKGRYRLLFRRTVSNRRHMIRNASQE